MVTKSLVILGDSQLTTTTGDASIPADKRIRAARCFAAYDKTTGKEVGAVFMPAPSERIADVVSIDGQAVHHRVG